MECSEEELCDILKPYMPWLNAKAAKMTDANLREDLAQEGLIAMWRAARKFDPSRGVPLDFYVRQSAIWRMLTVVQKDVYTGAPRRLKKESPPAIPVSPIPVSGDEGSYRTSLLDILDRNDRRRATDPAFDSVPFSAHRQDIIDALNSELTANQRKFVVLKLMYGLSPSELTRYFGYPPSNTISAKHKERLAEALIHLKGLVDGSEEA